MAYTNAPSNDTYSTKRVPIAAGIALRAGWPNTGKDAGMINVLPFKHIGADGNPDIWGETRYTITATSVNTTAGNVTRGMYVWEKSIGTVYYFMVVNTRVYTSTNATTWAQVDTLTLNATTPVRFCEFIDATNQKKLVMVDGSEGYVYTSNAAGTKIVDVDFPSPHVPFPVFMDGYLFLAKAGTGDIYNSNLNDPALWTAGDFISSELYPDDVQALLKIKNYVVAVGTNGCEYFYDAANAISSPLQRQEGGLLPFGTQFPNTIATTKDRAVMVANNNDGEAVLKIIEDHTYKELVCPFLAQFLNTAVSSAGGYNALRGYFFRQRGELFYAICMNGTLTSTNPPSGDTATFVYSFSTGLWCEFNYVSQYLFPVYFTASSTTGSVLTYIAGSFNGIAFFGTFQSSHLGINVYDQLTASSQQAVYQELRTAPVDCDTLNRKFLSRVGLGYTKLNEEVETGTATATMPFLTYTDDDWHSLAIANRQFLGANMTADGGFPFITQLGSFRQRSFLIATEVPQSFQWKFLELDINKGQQ